MKSQTGTDLVVAIFFWQHNTLRFYVGRFIIFLRILKTRYEIILFLDANKVNLKILVHFLIRSWSSLVLHPLDVKGSVQLFLSSLNHYAVSVPQEQVGYCIH